MRRQRQESPSKNNGSINHQATDYTLNLLPSCSKDGVHFVHFADDVAGISSAVNVKTAMGFMGFLCTD